MNPWLPNAERVGCTKSGGSYDGTPYCFVIHTTEGDPGTVDGCRALAESHGSPPQLWFHPTLRWLGQGLPLDRSAYALAHDSGDPQTNKAGAIQVEVFGFAADTPGWTTECDNIGTDVLAPVLAAGWPIDVSQVAPTTGADGYGTDGPVRLSWDAWATFPGVCCHSNVPGNAHWDAGAIDLPRIVAAATGATPAPAPVEDDDMPYFLFSPGPGGDGRWWFTNLRTDSRPCDTLDDAINVDYHLQTLAHLPGLICNRDARGAVAGPIEVDHNYLATITSRAAGAPAP